MKSTGKLARTFFSKTTMAKHNNIGKEGELIAQKHLKNLDYKILHTNWVCNKNELDIVAVKNNSLIVVEVKTRSSEHFGQPKDAITAAKIKRIVQATNDYIQQFEIDLEVRFDVMSIIMKDDEEFSIEHIKDAFLPPNE